MSSVIYNNKVALLLLALVLVALLSFIALSLAANANGFDFAGISTMRYCVGSGGVCTGV